jgi:dTDP-4-dehydrorhamnose 3,5-epimerase
VIIRPTILEGLLIVEPEKFRDERGFFTRTFSQQEFEDQGVSMHAVETNVSFNEKNGTLRGMHYQESPFAQAKLVRCTSGSIFDVAIDLRQDSSTFKQWFGLELSSENHFSLFIPVGFAHGFQTLEDRTEVCYLMSEVYAPDYARGVRWNDPAFGINWPPATERVINPRDQNYPDFML